MSDLISRSSVINLLRELKIDNVAVNGKRITDYIKEQPIAYDVEKVVAELEKLADDSNDHMYESYFDGKEDGIRETIDIVKRGGIDGKI